MPHRMLKLKRNVTLVNPNYSSLLLSKGSYVVSHVRTQVRYELRKNAVYVLRRKDTFNWIFCV